MAESSLERLKRLAAEKKAKELGNAQVQAQEAEPKQELQESTGTVSPSDALDVLPSDSTIRSGDSTGSDGAPELVGELANPKPKPMTAMERLRALKSGGTQGDSSRSDSSSNFAPAIVEPPKIVKERKTHPIAMEMAELEQALDSHVPGFVSILSTIHKKLKQDPDVVTLLDDDEIAIIVAGLEKHTNVTIVAPSAAKAAKSKARKEPVSAMDL